jgi:benzodiazapine receptor
MSATHAFVFALVVCIISAVLEGLAAGNNIKPFFARLKVPAYAPPLWLWIMVGIAYYVMCFFILFRILHHEGNDTLRHVSLALLAVAMAVNVLYNYTFFRLQNLFYTNLTIIPYLPALIGLFYCLWQFDQTAAYALMPYFVYLPCVSFLQYKFWELNPDLRGR